MLTRPSAENASTRISLSVFINVGAGVIPRSRMPSQQRLQANEARKRSDEEESGPYSDLDGPQKTRPNAFHRSFRESRRQVFINGTRLRELTEKADRAKIGHRLSSLSVEQPSLIASVFARDAGFAGSSGHRIYRVHLQCRADFAIHFENKKAAKRVRSSKVSGLTKSSARSKRPQSR